MVKKTERPILEAERLYNLNEVAAICGVHVATVRRWVKFGELPAKRIGRRWFVLGAALHPPIYSQFDKNHVK